MKLKNPLTGLQDKFWIFLDILSELGGTYVPIRSEPSTKRTGRRDPDTKPRQYPLDDRKYEWTRKPELSGGEHE